MELIFKTQENKSDRIVEYKNIWVQLLYHIQEVIETRGKKKHNICMLKTVLSNVVEGSRIDDLMKNIVFLRDAAMHKIKSTLHTLN